MNRQIFLNQVDLASLKPDINKLNIEKLKTVPPDLSKPIKAVENYVVKNQCLMNLLKKVNAIDSDKQNLKKILKILIKRHLIPVNLL